MTDKIEKFIYKEDDFRAFGGELLTINANIPENYTVSKAEFRCGDLFLEFNNPVFPLHIAPSSEETKKLKSTNICYLKIYDENGFGITCKGNTIITAIDKAV